MEQRIDQLELKVSYLELHIEQLSTVIAQQQQQIDSLEKLTTLLREQMRQMAPSNIRSQSEETPPPHY